MKSYPVKQCNVLAIVLSLFLPALGYAQGQSGKVTVTDHRVEIHPGTKLLAADEKALNDVLARYDKALYRVETYDEKGKRVGAQGTLDPDHIDKALAAEVANAKRQHALTFTVDQTVNSPKTQNIPPQVQEKFLKEVKKILKKYERK
jgi:hypothetical protein